MSRSDEAIAEYFLVGIVVLTIILISFATIDYLIGGFRNL